MRQFWLNCLHRISHPVLDLLAKDGLSSTLPATGINDELQHLEAFGRVLCGISPWLELQAIPENERDVQTHFSALVVDGLDNLVNPNAKDYADFSLSPQSLVDGAYLVQGLFRSPSTWTRLSSTTKSRLINELLKTRNFQPPETNWLLFASMIECGLLSLTKSCDQKRLKRGIRRFLNHFYVGDGFYGDGYHFSMDHYNSFVIHPMLIDVLMELKQAGQKGSNQDFEANLPRYQRYTQIQERLISPEGAYPILGRTMICRLGVFHALAQATLKGLLHPALSLGSVRSAMSSVLRYQFQNSLNFDHDQLLTIGFNGVQGTMAESYVSRGSAYHATTFFLPLGLSAEHQFWTAPDEKWTSKKAYDGDEFAADHALHEPQSIMNDLKRASYRISKAITHKLKMG